MWTIHLKEHYSKESFKAMGSIIFPTLENNIFDIPPPSHQIPSAPHIIQELNVP